MIKQIYFDFGNVLVVYENAFKKVCADFGLDFNKFFNFFSKHDNVMTLGKMTTVEFWEKCIEKYSLKNAKNYDLTRWWVSDYEIIKPVSDFIYSLENKINIGIISNIYSGVWESAFKYKLVPNIKYNKIYLSYKEKMRKPNLDFYEKIQGETGVKAEEILFIDDMEQNLIVPQNLGWKTVLFNRFETEKGIEEIKKFLIINEI